LIGQPNRPGPDSVVDKKCKLTIQPSTISKAEQIFVFANKERDYKEKNTAIFFFKFLIDKTLRYITRSGTKDFMLFGRINVDLCGFDCYN